VVDLVQVIQGHAAVKAAIADGVTRDRAQYLGVYVRNQNRGCGLCRWPATCAWTCAGGLPGAAHHQLAKLATDALLMSGATHAYYFIQTCVAAPCTRSKSS
jgi:hypothetical protein